MFGRSKTAVVLAILSVACAAEPVEEPTTTSVMLDEASTTTAVITTTSDTAVAREPAFLSAGRTVVLEPGSEYVVDGFAVPLSFRIEDEGWLWYGVADVWAYLGWVSDGEPAAAVAIVAYRSSLPPEEVAEAILSIDGVDAANGAAATAIGGLEAVTLDVEGAPERGQLGELRCTNGVGRFFFDQPGYPLVVESGTNNQLLAVSDGRWVYGINAKTGERQWRTGPPDIVDPEWIMAQEIEVVSGTGRGFERRVFVLTDGNLVLLDGDDGSVRWSVPVSGPPGSVPDETAFVSGVDGELVALSVVSGDELWSVPESRLELPPFEFGESVFVLDGSEIVALNSRSGRERGRAQLPDGSVSRFGVIAGRVIVAVGDQLFAVSSPE